MPLPCSSVKLSVFIFYRLLKEAVYKEVSFLFRNNTTACMNRQGYPAS